MLDKDNKHICTQAHPYRFSPSLFFIIFLTPSPTVLASTSDGSPTKPTISFELLPRPSPLFPLLLLFSFRTSPSVRPLVSPPPSLLLFSFRTSPSVSPLLFLSHPSPSYLLSSCLPLPSPLFPLLHCPFPSHSLSPLFLLYSTVPFTPIFHRSVTVSPLFPLPLPSLLSLFLSPLPCAPYPLLPLLLLSSPSSFDFLLHSLFPVFEPLFQLSLLTFVPFSPILFSISLLHSSTSCSFSPVFIFSNSLAFFFHSLASFSHLSPSTQALHTKFIFFTFPV